MLGSEFVTQFGSKGVAAWEAAAIQLARADSLTPWPWVLLPLTDGTNTVTLRVSSDVLSIGPFEDHLRLPMTPSAAQSICNLFGWVMPTAWINYQIWRAAQLKMQPLAMPNRSPTLSEFAQHSARIDAQLASAIANAPPGSITSPLVSGIKKLVVVSNIMKRNVVVIQGWYRPPPAPDVFDDHTKIVLADGLPNPNRQPIQPISNIHYNGFVDYSHGIQPIFSTATVDAPGILEGEHSVADLYQHPILSRLLSNEGPIKMPRYPASVQPQVFRPVGSLVYPAAAFRATLPATADMGLAALLGKRPI